MSDSNSNMKTRFVASFMQFLSEELNNDELSADSKESIEGMYFFTSRSIDLK